MSDSAGIVLDWTPRGRSGAIALTIRLDGDVLAAERLDVLRPEKRRDFVDRFGKKHAAFGEGERREALEKQLLEIAGEVAANAGTDSDEMPAVEAASHRDESVIVELAWNVQAGAPDFVVYDRKTGSVSRQDSVETTVGRLVLPEFTRHIVTPGGDVEGAVLVPTEPDFGRGDEIDDEVLRQDVRAFVNRYVELPNGMDFVAVEYALFSWVFDSFDELPYLSFRTVDCGRGKSRALETVGAVCYRPLIVGGGSSSAAILRMLDRLGGTLVCDEFDHASDTELAANLTKILNQGFQRRRPLIKCVGEDNTPTPFKCYGPKIFALRQGLGDDATESRIISIRMHQRTRGDIPLTLPRARFDAEALAIRNRLLAWRFRRIGQVSTRPELANALLEDRHNQIGLPLLSIARSADVRQRIVDALRSQQESVAQERADSLAGEVLAVIVEIHSPDETVRPGLVAREVNVRRAQADGVDPDKLPVNRKLSPQKVGRILRGELELPPDDPARDNEGARYRLDPARLVQLGRRFGHRPAETPPTSRSSPMDKRDESAECGEAHASAPSGESAVNDVCDDSRGAGAEGRFEGDGGDEGASLGNVPAGWTREGWAKRLLQMADRCEQDHPEVAAKYRSGAATLMNEADCAAH